jgi:hypothetical protein
MLKPDSEISKTVKISQDTLNRKLAHLPLHDPRLIVFLSAMVLFQSPQNSFCKSAERGLLISALQWGAAFYPEFFFAIIDL